MEKKYRILLFDLDGTLTDSKPGIINCLQYAFDRLGYVYGGLDLNQFLGPPLNDTFGATVGEAHTEEAIRLFRERYRREGMYENRIYDGVPELLNQLRQTGCPLAIATSKLEDYAEQILQHFGLADYFMLIAGSLSDNSRQKKDEVISFVLQETGYTAADTLMIGDKHHDLDAAARLGLDGLGVLYGYGGAGELEGCPSVCLAENPAAVWRFLQGRIKAHG